MGKWVKKAYMTKTDSIDGVINKIALVLHHPSMHKLLVQFFRCVFPVADRRHRMTRRKAIKERFTTQDLQGNVDRAGGACRTAARF